MRPAGAEHAIHLEPDQNPPHRPLYSMSEKKLYTLREYLETALQNGWIRPSASEDGAPIGHEEGWFLPPLCRLSWSECDHEEESAPVASDQRDARWARACRLLLIVGFEGCVAPYSY